MTERNSQCDRTNTLARRCCDAERRVRRSSNVTFLIGSGILATSLFEIFAADLIGGVLARVFDTTPEETLLEAARFAVAAAAMFAAHKYASRHPSSFSTFRRDSDVQVENGND